MVNKTDINQYCSNWYQTLSGQSALASTEELCAKVMSEIFGYYAIQIGMLSGECDLLKDSRIANSFALVNPNNFIGINSDKKQQHAVISTNEQLPISTDDVDLVVASHVLEMSQNPHLVLREIDRVLVPEGHCILVGFNPYALSNISMNKSLSFLQRRKEAQIKGSNKMRSVTRVRDWFSLLGFEVIDVNYMGFRPKIQNQKLFNSLQWMERWGEYAGPLLGSIYVVYAKKQVTAIRPNKKVWRAPALLKGGKVALNRTAQKVRRDNFSNL